MTEKTEICFDGWRLRADTGELSRDGETQRLTQQPLRILLELLARPGELVSRERLVEVLWPKGVVDYDNGLNVAMRKLRLALGDDTESPRYIETLSRKGYRFIGTLEPAPGAALAPTVSGKTDATPVPASIPAKEGGYRRQWIFAGGIVGGAALLATWLVWILRSTGAPAVEAGDPQEKIVQAPIVARRTTSVRAYEHYLQGIYHRSRRDTNATPLAIAEFEAALKEDPAYAEAWAGLADTYVGAAIGHGIPTKKAFALARDAALEGVKLDPGLAETHTALGQIYMFADRDYPAAEAEYALARAANEKYARLWHHLGMLRAFQGRAEESLAALRRARELEPMTLLFSSNHALVLYHSRQYEEAIELARQLLASQPSLHQARSLLIRALVATGRVDEAMRELPLRTNEMPNVSDGALVYAHAGKRDKAQAEIKRMEKMSADGFGVGYELAVAHAALGELDAGCKSLELAWGDSSPFLGWMRLDPRMDPLRDQNCFAEILGRFDIQ